MRTDIERTGGGHPVAGLDVIVTGTASDSHTWNLVYLHLLLEELGHRVANLGPCVPDELMVAECRRRRPALIVLSSVNGHGLTDGARVVELLRACPELAGTPIVIGGKLGIAGADNARHSHTLLDAGFDAVFEDGAGLGLFRSFVAALPGPATNPTALPGTGTNLTALPGAATTLAVAGAARPDDDRSGTDLPEAALCGPTRHAGASR
ncbi:cobalamin-dependent protein [Longispora sp. NPDC051575]|uniref:cobalamin B12-binding domain-containing protein n=1 Tax=Longispora sp. NPDC051575 TaxID=3154943 RepID=UPI00344458DE